MAAIVDARGHFVEHRLAAQGKEFDSQHADIVERFGNGGGEPRAPFDRRREHGGRGNRRTTKDATFMHIVRRIPQDDPAIPSPAQQDRKLAVKGDKAFQNRRRAVHRGPSRIGFRRRHEPRLALSIIAQPPRFQDRGRADLGHGRVEPRAIVDRSEGRGATAERGDEALFRQPVLRDLERARRRVKHGVLGQCLERAGGDILELVGHHVDLVSEARQRVGIVERPAGEARGHLRRGRCLCGRVDMAAIAQRRGGEREHPPELSAPDNADGRARRDHSGRSSTASVCAARQASSRAASASSPSARMAAAASPALAAPGRPIA